MSARMPATCGGCGALVELRLAGQVEERQSSNNGTVSSRSLPTAWCEPGTDAEHVCGERAFVVTSGQKESGRGDVCASRGLANPGVIGVSDAG